MAVSSGDPPELHVLRRNHQVRDDVGRDRQRHGLVAGVVGLQRDGLADVPPEGAAVERYLQFARLARLDGIVGKQCAGAAAACVDAADFQRGRARVGEAEYVHVLRVLADVAEIVVFAVDLYLASVPLAASTTATMIIVRNGSFSFTGRRNQFAAFHLQL